MIFKTIPIAFLKTLTSITQKRVSFSYLSHFLPQILPNPRAIVPNN